MIFVFAAGLVVGLLGGFVGGRSTRRSTEARLPDVIWGDRP